MGPVYIHTKCSGPYMDIHSFPPAIKARPWLAIRGYDEKNRLHTAELVKGHDVEKSIGKVFEDAEVDYIHIRHGVMGCFMMRIEQV